MHQIQEVVSHSSNPDQRYIAYFQAYTNTYGPIPLLREIYFAALSHPEIAGLSIGTRPDCLGTDVLKLLAECKQTFPDKFIWVELGLQTIHSATAKRIRRGYDLSVFRDAIQNLTALSISPIVHVILGLPGEDTQMILDTIRYLNQVLPQDPVSGIKLQLLHVLKDTDLADWYRQGIFQVLSKDTYIDLLCQCVATLRPDIVIHRLTGDGPKDLLLAPKWSQAKRQVLNEWQHKMKALDILQGQNCTVTTF